MKHDLKKQHLRLIDEAHRHDLAIVNGSPDVTHLGTVSWEADTETFLSYAKLAGAKLIYTDLYHFDYKNSIKSEIEESGVRVTEDEEKEWFIQRVTEATQNFTQYSGQPSTLRSLWIKDGIAHVIYKVAEWDEAFSCSVQEAISSALEVVKQNRRQEKDEKISSYFEKAKAMAKHERFLDASNDVKREFMAEQLFPGEEDHAYHRIVELAVLYHWWDVEPGEHLKNVARIRVFSEKGFSPRHIGMMLNISEAKVRNALAEKSNL